MMYILLVRVFGAHKKKWLIMYSLIGWGKCEAEIDLPKYARELGSLFMGQNYNQSITQLKILRIYVCDLFIS